MARLDLSGGSEMVLSTGLEETLFNLGIASATGRDGTADLVAAHMWFNLAAARGHGEAAQYRQEVAIEMSAAEIAEAQRAAREWLRAQ